MAQLMPLPLTVSCSSIIQIGLPFWYRLTWVVPEKEPSNGCVCVCQRDGAIGLKYGGFKTFCVLIWFQTSVSD